MPAQIVSVARSPVTRRDGLTEKPTTAGYEFRLAFDGAVDLEQVARLLPPTVDARLRYASDTTYGIIDVLIDDGDSLVDALVRERGRSVDPLVEGMMEVIVDDGLGQVAVSGLAQHLVELATRPADAARNPTDLCSFEVAWISHVVLPKASHHVDVVAPGMRRLFRGAWEDAHGWEEASGDRHAEVTERMIDLLAPERDRANRDELEFDWATGALLRFVAAPKTETDTEILLPGPPVDLSIAVAQIPVQPPRWTKPDWIEPSDLQLLDLLTLPMMVKAGLGAAAGLAARAARGAGTRMVAWGGSIVEANLGRAFPYGVTSVVSDIEMAAGRLVVNQVDDVVEAAASHTAQLLSPEVVAALPRFSAVHARLALPAPVATPLAEVERVLAAHGKEKILTTTAGEKVLLTVDETSCIIRFGDGTIGGGYGAGLYKCSDAPIVLRALAEDVVEGGIPQYERYGALLQIWPGKKLGKDVLEEAVRTHIQIQEVKPGSQVLLSLVGPQEAQGKILVPRDLPFNAYDDPKNLAPALALPGGMPQVAVVSGPHGRILTGTIGGLAVGPVPLTTAGLEQFLTKGQAGGGGVFAFIASFLGAIVDWDSGSSESTETAGKGVPALAWPNLNGAQPYDSDGDGEADMTLGSTRERGDEPAPHDDAAHPKDPGHDGQEWVPPQPAGGDGGTRADDRADLPGTTFDMEADAARRAAQQTLTDDEQTRPRSPELIPTGSEGLDAAGIDDYLQATALDFLASGEEEHATQQDPARDSEEGDGSHGDVEHGPRGDEVDSADEGDARSGEEEPDEEELDEEGPDDEDSLRLGPTGLAASQGPVGSSLQGQVEQQTLFQQFGVPDPILELAATEMVPAADHDDGLDDLFDVDVDQLLESSPPGDADDTTFDGTGDDEVDISHSAYPASQEAALAPTRQESDDDDVEEGEDELLWQQGPS